MLYSYGPRRSSSISAPGIHQEALRWTTRTFKTSACETKWYNSLDRPSCTGKFPHGFDDWTRGSCNVVWRVAFTMGTMERLVIIFQNPKDLEYSDIEDGLLVRIRWDLDTCDHDFYLQGSEAFPLIILWNTCIWETVGSIICTSLSLLPGRRHLESLYLRWMPVISKTRKFPN